MKKRVLAMLMVAAMSVAMIAGCGKKDTGAAEGSAAKTEATELPSADEVTFDAEPEFDPNPDYDKYTVFEYTIEDAGATFAVTLSAMADDSKMEIHCNFYGDEQLVVAEKDGDTFKVIEDKTGFMETDTPAICQMGIDNDNWAAIAK